MSARSLEIQKTPTLLDAIIYYIVSFFKYMFRSLFKCNRKQENNQPTELERVSSQSEIENDWSKFKSSI